MVNLSSEDYQRIHGTVNFMREATALIDPDEALNNCGITDLEAFSESQLIFLFTRAGINHPDIKLLFKTLKDMQTKDIHMINQDGEFFNQYILIAGGLYYAKAIRRLIKKQDILTVKNIFSDEIYKFIFDFATDKQCLEDFILTEDFHDHIYAIGHHIYQTFLGRFNPLIMQYLAPKLELKDPEKPITHLRISNEYMLSLANITQEFVIKNLLES